MQQGFSMPSGYNFGLTPVKFTRNEKKENTDNSGTNNSGVINNPNSLALFNQYQSIFNPYQNNTLNYGLFGNNTMNNYNNGIVGVMGNQDWSAYNYAKNNNLMGTPYSITGFMNSNLHQTTLDKMKTDPAYQAKQIKTGKDAPSTETGSSFGDWLGDKTSWLGDDWMTKLENVQNLANIGLGGLSAYANWDSYKMNKNLAQKNIALLEQQIEQNRENMENTRQERARRDKMRSNAQSQRASTSSIRG